MSECGVCIGSDDYDCSLDFQDVTWPKARKEHKCCECSRIIGVGEEYQRWAGKWDGTVESFKTCLRCVEIRDGFSCGNSTAFGAMWAEMREYVFPIMNTACFDKVESVEAKAFLRSQWMNWKFANERLKEEARSTAQKMIAKARRPN
jgi:hypothetical protein